MTNEELHKTILALTNEWYSLIRGEHHKDRDCHWYIETKWSYGEPPVYHVYHYGYVGEEVDVPCATYEEALNVLWQALTDAIKLINQNESPDRL